MNRFVTPASVLNQRPPAIVQQARNCAYYEQAFDKMVSRHSAEYGALLEEFKTSGVWKDKYGNWDTACQGILDISKRYADKLIEKHRGNKVPKVPDAIEKDKSETLNNIAKLPDPLSTDPDTDGQYEKPAVHSADEAKPKVRQPIENGKPKHMLALWGEMEQSLGRLLNRCDELNRTCPHKTYHSQFIRDVKSCMDALELWRESTK